MNTDIVWGGLLVLGTVCATIQHYITKKSAESEIASLKTRLEFAKQETRIWKTTAYRHADERNHAVRMAQYWRKQALNEHFGFEPEKAAPSPTVAEVVNGNDAVRRADAGHGLDTRPRPRRRPG